MKKIMTMACAALMLFACGMASGCKDELKAEEYVETNYPAPVAENAPEGVSFRFLLYPDERYVMYDVTCENGRLKTYWDDKFAEALTNFSHPTDPAPDRLFDHHASIYQTPDVELDGADTDKMEDWPYVDYIYAPGEDGELVDFVTVICSVPAKATGGFQFSQEGIICFTVIKVEPKDLELTATVVKSVSYKHERRGFYVGQPYSRVKKEIAKTIRENR